MEKIFEPSREIEVIRETDVLIIGGGPGGIGAAIASARNGSRTTLIEQYNCLGGVATSGLMLFFSKLLGESTDEFIIKGIPFEFHNRMANAQKGQGTDESGAEIVDSVIYKNQQNKKQDGWGGQGNLLVDPELAKIELDNMMKEANVDLFYHTFGAFPIIQNKSIKGVFIEGKSGRKAILSKITIDATGDGDIAAYSGATFEKGRPGDGKLQPVSMMFLVRNVNIKRLLEYRREDPDFKDAMEKASQKQSGYNFHQNRRGRIAIGVRPNSNECVVSSSNIINIDPTDIESLTIAEIKGREQVHKLFEFLRNFVPGCENSFLSQTGHTVGIRESRRIIGEYILSEDDVMNGVQFTDSIAQGSYPIDVHDPECDAMGMVFHKFNRINATHYDIPYRCLVPKKIENLLVSGRCISASYYALGSSRVMYTCMAIGEAAGAAAALTIRNKTSPREVDVNQLRQILHDQGALC